jgi:copper chaperone CopZ
MNKKAKSEFSMDIPALKINVEGMTCQHCKRKVEEGLLEMDGVSTVTANPDANTVEIYGHNLKLQSIQKTVEELGYDFKGKL